MVGLSLDEISVGAGLFSGILGQSLLGHLGYRKRHLDELVQLVTTVPPGRNPVRLVVQPRAS